MQAQILNLLLELQKEMSLSYLFISHDLDVVRHMTERLVVLYRGKVMEVGDTETVAATPGHPYTRALLSAVPLPHPDEQARRRVAREKERLSSAGTSAAAPCCRFVDRCPYAIDVCEAQEPELAKVLAGGSVACHRRDDLPERSMACDESEKVATRDA